MVSSKNQFTEEQKKQAKACGEMLGVLIGLVLSGLGFYILAHKFLDLNLEQSFLVWYMITWYTSKLTSNIGVHIVRY